MPLGASEKREIIQLLLVALEYLRLGCPPTALEELTLSNAVSAFSKGKGNTCSEWFHIMFRDSIGHRERDATPDAIQETRYADRQDCIERTSFRFAHKRLQQTADELVRVLKAEGITLPSVREG